MFKHGGVTQKKRGVAILLAIFFMILLSLIATALIGMVPVELQSSTRTKLDLQAHYAATSAIRHAKKWCSAVMTPSSETNNPEFLGDSSETTGNSYYTGNAGYYNEVTGVNGTVATVEFEPMQLKDVWDDSNIPHSTSKWDDTTKYGAGAGVWAMLNIPKSGNNAVADTTVVLVQKAPIKMGDWSTYSVIVPDADTPGGKNTMTGSTITTFFGGSGKSGRRCYQIIALAYYQGFPTLRAKSTVLEDSFARYSLFVDQDPNKEWLVQAQKGYVSTVGPVHTNGFFRFAIDPDLWGSSSSNPVPFQGLMTFAQSATTADHMDAAHPGDGNLYSQGNDQDGSDENYRPFDTTRAIGESGSYAKMITGGVSNLRKVSKVSLPPDSTKLSTAAYGTDYNVGAYSNSAIASHVAIGTGTNAAPDGIFVFANATNGKAAGGVVVKGDQEKMFLDVVDGNGNPMGVTNTSQLADIEAGTASGNPGMRVQSKQSQTAVSTQTTLSTSVSTKNPTTTSSSAGTSVSTRTSVVNLSGTFTSTTSTTSVSRTTTTTRIVTSSTSVRTSLSYLTSVSTSLSSTVRTLTTPRYGTSTLTNTTPVTSTFSSSTLSYSTSVTTGGLGGAVRQTLTFTNTVWTTWFSTSTRTNTTVTSSVTSTQTNFSTSTSTIVTTRTTGTNTITSTRTSTYTITSTLGSSSTTLTSTFLTTVTRSTGTTTSLSYSTSTIYTPVTIAGTTTTLTNTIVNTVTETFKPIDQMIEAKNLQVTINPTMFQSANTSNFALPAGAATGTGTSVSPAAMDVSKLNSITQILVASGSNLTPLSAATVIGTDNIVVLKQSRTDPHQMIMFVIPSTKNSEGALLNGAVYTEGNIGDPGVPGSGGVAGVNYGRKTIGGQIQSTNVTGTNGAFGLNPEKASVSVGIVNNLWQFGTKRTETNPNVLKAENGLGLVADEVRLNASTRDFFSSGQSLNIQAVILGGSSAGGDGGLTVKGIKTLNGLTSTALGADAGQTPIVNFVGGLILRNYYTRLNLVNGAGWYSTNVYNQQLALKPPPYFPNNGLLIPLSYVEERTWSDQTL